MNSDFITSLIRTYVPMLVGAITTWLLSRGIELDANTTSGLVAFLTGAFSALYYLIVRLFERKFPQAGVLLGRAAKPKY